MMLMDDPMPERIARGLDGLAVDPDRRVGPTCGHGGNFAAGAAIRALRGKRKPEFRGT